MKNSKDTFASYLTDVKSVGLLTQPEEEIAFRRIDGVETKLFQNILSNKTFARSFLSTLEKSVKKESTYEQSKAAIRAIVSGSKSQANMYAFMRMIRFTESGREWMQEVLSSAIKTNNPKAWATKNSQLYRELQGLRNKFATANLRLVVKIAKSYWRIPMSQTLGDLVQEGNFGLMKAIERFDIERGYKFSTYALWWIRHYVKRAIAERDALVRIPVHLSDRIHQIARTEARHYTLTGQNIDEDELGEMSGNTIDKVRQALISRRRVVSSLDSPMGDSDVTLMETIPDPGAISPFDAVDHKKMTDDIRELLTGLTPNESRIIRWRFGLDGEVPMTLQEVAEKFGLTRERIRQIEFRALGKLKQRPQAREYKSMMFQQTG